MKTYSLFRKDGWPFCPICEEDELYSIVMLNWNDKTPRASLQECLEKEMRCYACGWSSAKSALWPAGMVIYLNRR